MIFPLATWDSRHEPATFLEARRRAGMMFRCGDMHPRENHKCIEFLVVREIGSTVEDVCDNLSAGNESSVVIVQHNRTSTTTLSRMILFSFLASPLPHGAQQLLILSH